MNRASVIGVLWAGAVNAGAAQEEDFLRRTRAATEQFRDPELAMRAGYRPVGPDAPAMGRHWLHPRIATEGTIDPERPAILSYAVVEGRHALVGVAFVVPLGPGAPLPAEPAGPEAWHVHGRTLDVEGVVLRHGEHPAGADSGWRAAVLHAWVWAPNPAGPFTPDNWTLPYVRLGFTPPRGAPTDAARALALATGGDGFYAAQFAVAADLDPRDARAVAAVAATHAARVRRWTGSRAAPRLTAADVDWLVAAWRDFRDDVLGATTAADRLDAVFAHLGH